jgi:kanamycin kinase/aminoglycoside 3'-phosphotransferase-3
MKALQKIPQSIADMVGGRSFYLDDIGRSDSKILLFEDRVLKIEKMTENARREYEILSFLQGKLPVPKILAREESEGYQYLLMTKLQTSR